MPEEVFKEAPPLSEDDKALIDTYARMGVPTDQLPYSKAFDEIHADLEAKGDTRSREELFQRLLNLRKAGRLPRLMPPTLSSDSAASGAA